MVKRTQIGDPNKLQLQLAELIDEFGQLVDDNDIRAKVLALIPIHHKLRSLGVSVQPKPVPRGSRDRVLQYLLLNVGNVVRGDELMIVSGISEYARRIRELRKQFGWQILSGYTVRNMRKSGEDIEALKEMKTDEYLLTSNEPDTEAANRWHMGNTIRRKKVSATAKLLEYFRANVGQELTGEELQYVAKKQNWPRRVRELRTEEGWPIATRVSGRLDLPIGSYVLEKDRQAPEHDRRIPDSLRGQVLRRDNYTCQDCDWNHDLHWNPSDPRHLELHHVIRHVERGPNTAENLITLCNICHDERHRSQR